MYIQPVAYPVKTLSSFNPCFSANSVFDKPIKRKPSSAKPKDWDPILKAAGGVAVLVGLIYWLCK